MTSLLCLSLLLGALTDGPARPLPVGAHNCYSVNRAVNPRLAEALALGIDNIEIDLGWDAAGDRLIIGHDAAPRPGVTYPAFEATLAPALEAHWKAHPPAPCGDADGADRGLQDRRLGGSPPVQGVPRRSPRLVLLGPEGARVAADRRRLTVCLTGSEAAKAAYDALVPPGGTYRAFRDRVFGAGARYEDDVAAYAATAATPYHRFLTLHWSAVERGGPALAGEWTDAESARLVALVRLAHDRGYRVRFYCLNGHTGAYLSGYRFRDDVSARARWLAAARAGADWVASDEYREIVAALGSA